MATTTKLILTHSVAKLGAAGEVVEVKSGYARNFLLPRSLATPWTKGAQRQIEQMAAARSKRAIASLEDAQALRDLLKTRPLVIAERAGESGRLFGAVTSGEVADAVKETFDREIDRRTVAFDAPIKTLGEYTVTIHLHDEVDAKVIVQVVAAKGARA
ncbi:50S ribosomal protein L9 [Helcobacillus sp. ACRRO]|uniref:50S ribosomal protein L9 n=1 Tax=Helcobacillus sp. ACRRO TaxID=2918202 RepID=UPI001EF61588|nr:50S ribosomal protein L9 [Helcobacillus sp. ACRRO]MCG7427809.1 50S ribosomal protein L9 [Helcobacillus sp. ACRRO]